MKAREIIYIGGLFFAGFLISEFLVEHMAFQNPAQRFVGRVVFLSGMYCVLYLMFALRDANRRLRIMESLFARERRIRIRNCRHRSSKMMANRKDINGQFKGR